MSLLQNMVKNKAEEQARLLMLQNLKNGRTPEQCKCIDYLYTPVDNDAKKGCGSKKSGKKKGCLGGESTWDINDYIKHVDALVNKLNLREKAIAKIGLDESQISEIKPINIASFLWKGDGIVTKSEETNISGIWKSVSNKYAVTWIFFSAKQIYTYTYTLDTTTDNVTELTRDFFYKDVTCIRTEHEVEDLVIEKTAGCGCLKKQESKFYHRYTEYDTLQISVPNDSYSFCCTTNEEVEQSIQAAKGQIREKKDV